MILKAQMQAGGQDRRCW